MKKIIGITVLLGLFFVVGCSSNKQQHAGLVKDDNVGALFRLQRRGEKIETVRYEAERIAFAIEQEIEIR